MYGERLCPRGRPISPYLVADITGLRQKRICLYRLRTVSQKQVKLTAFVSAVVTNVDISNINILMSEKSHNDAERPRFILQIDGKRGRRVKRASSPGRKAVSIECALCKKCLNGARILLLQLFLHLLQKINIHSQNRYQNR